MPYSIYKRRSNFVYMKVLCQLSKVTRMNYTAVKISNWKYPEGIHVHGAQGHKTVSFYISVIKQKNFTGNLTSNALFLTKK